MEGITLANPEDNIRAAPKITKEQPAEEAESSSGSESSGWDDWQDPEYIEEQRKALTEFSKKQKEIRAAHGAKKKKKKKKSKKGSGAHALGMEDSQIPGAGDGASDGYGDEGDESKIEKTRMEDDQINSQYDGHSIEHDQPPVKGGIQSN